MVANINDKNQIRGRCALRDVSNSNHEVVNNSDTLGKISKRVHHGGPSSRFDEANNNSTTTTKLFESGFRVRPTTNNPQQGSSNSSSSSYQHTGIVDDDLDKRDRDNALCVSEYVMDMYEYFRKKETTVCINFTYMESQPHINERMRGILVDWLIEVHLKFKLLPETLYLTINLIDRYLEREKGVPRRNLQLVGVACLLIASKYEEIYPPEVRDLVYICDRAYTNVDIIQMEGNILKLLEFRITVPSAHTFLIRFLKAAHADKPIVRFACYVLDGTLQSYNLLQYFPSQLAAASVMIARQIMGRNRWSPTLLKYARYSEEDIIPVARAILAEKKSTLSASLRAANKKYSDSKHGRMVNVGMLQHCEI